MKKKASHVEVFKMKRTTGWSVRKEFSRQRLTTQTFETIPEAEAWVNENVEGNYGTPWIDHVIEGSHGHLMAIEEWKDSCDGGMFIDYDGYGQLVRADMTLSEEYRKPTDWTHHFNDFPVEFTHILWYNR